MNKILLIWHCNSSLKVYLLYVNKEKFERIKKCHNKYIDLNADKELFWLSGWLIDKEEYLLFQSRSEEKLLFPAIFQSTLVVCGRIK